MAVRSTVYVFSPRDGTYSEAKLMSAHSDTEGNADRVMVESLGRQRSVAKWLVSKDLEYIKELQKQCSQTSGKS